MKNPRFSRSLNGRFLLSAFSTAALFAANASAATYYWDTNGATPGSGAATGAWDSSVSSLWTTDATGSIATIPVTTAADSDLIFSAGSNGTAGSISIAGTQLANTLTFAQSGLTFSSGAITLTSNNPATPSVIVQQDTTINATGNLSNFSAINVASGKTLTLSSTNTAVSSNNFFLSESNTSTGGIVGGGTVQLTAGRFTTQSNPFIKNGSATTGGIVVTGTAVLDTASGGFQIGRDGIQGRTVINSSTASILSAGQITVGRGTVGRFVISDGTVSNTATSLTDSSILVGREGNGVGTIDVSGGAFNVIGSGIGSNTGGVVALNANGNSATNSGTLNISGGVVQIKELSFNRGNKRGDTSTAGSGTLNLSGGVLYIGGSVTGTDSVTTVAGGINNYGTGTSTTAINLTGGTLGANANWTSSMNMTLGTAGGGVTIKAANISNVAQNIALSGVLSGTGGLLKTGGGNLTLSGINTYTGLTQVNAGTLTLGSFTSINDAAGVAFVDASFISLSFASGSETISTLYDVTQNKYMTPGTWTATQLNDYFGGSTFSSAGGTLTVTAVPEPSTWAMLTVSLLMVCVVMKKRSRRLS